jgi:hypothetical protein
MPQVGATFYHCPQGAQLNSLDLTNIGHRHAAEQMESILDGEAKSISYTSSCYGKCGFLVTQLHQGCNFWNQNDRASKRLFFNMRSKIPHKFGNLVLICESQSNQGRPCLTWDLGFVFIDQMIPVNSWPQVIDQFDV